MHVNNLSFKYKKAKDVVLKDITFHLQKEKLNAVVGLNGSGKTSLFDCMTGILSINKGEISLPTPSDIMYQTQSLFFSPSIKTKDFVNFILRLNNKPAIGEAVELKEQFDDEEYQHFEKLWNMKLGTISIGERKWVFLMMLSCIQRSLYIFDEPMSGVDPSSRLRMVNRLKKLISAGKYCVISTHQLHDLTTIDCHIIIIHNGYVMYEGDYKEWLKSCNTNNPDEAFNLTCKNIN